MNGNALPTLMLYSAVYTAENKLQSVSAKQYTAETAVDGKIRIPLTLPQIKAGESYKIMLWDNNQAPVINSIQYKD